MSIQVLNYIKKINSKNTGWKNFNMVISGDGTNNQNPSKGSVPIADVASYRFIGDSMEIFYSFRNGGLAGSAGSGNYIFGFPNGIFADQSKLTVGVNNTVGEAYILNNSATDLVANGRVVVVGHSGVMIEYHGAITPSYVGAGVQPLSLTSIRYYFHAVVPVFGYSSYI